MAAGKACHKGDTLSSLNRGCRVVAALAALVEHGEITAIELSDYLGIGRYDAHAVLKKLATPTKAGVKRAYIVRWVWDHEGAKKYPRPVYAPGKKSDAKRPVADQLANKRAYYHRQKKLATMNSVFNLGIQWRAS
jgi:hypothetical protein